MPVDAFSDGGQPSNSCLWYHLLELGSVHSSTLCTCLLSCIDLLFSHCLGKENRKKKPHKTPQINKQANQIRDAEGSISKGAPCEM